MPNFRSKYDENKRTRRISSTSQGENTGNRIQNSGLLISANGTVRSVLVNPSLFILLCDATENYRIFLIDLQCMKNYIFLFLTKILIHFKKGYFFFNSLYISSLKSRLMYTAYPCRVGFLMMILL